MASAVFEGTSLVNMYVRGCWVNGIRRLIISRRGDEEEFYEIRTEWSDRNILYLHRSYSDLGRLFKRLLDSFPEDRPELSRSPLLQGLSSLRGPGALCSAGGRVSAAASREWRWPGWTGGGASGSSRRREGGEELEPLRTGRGGGAEKLRGRLAVGNSSRDVDLCFYLSFFFFFFPTIRLELMSPAVRVRARLGWGNRGIPVVAAPLRCLRAPRGRAGGWLAGKRV